MNGKMKALFIRTGIALIALFFIWFIANSLNSNELGMVIGVSLGAFVAIATFVLTMLATRPRKSGDSYAGYQQPKPQPPIIIFSQQRNVAQQRLNDQVYELLEQYQSNAYDHRIAEQIRQERITDQLYITDICKVDSMVKR